MTCNQHPDGQHRWHYGQRQLRSAGGGWFHPTVKESWVRGWFCLCGAEAPASEIPAIMHADAETRILRNLHWGQESGVTQGRFAL